MRSIYARQDDVDRTHRRATNEFLKYIVDLGRSSELHLHNFVGSVPDPDFADIDRQSLLTIRDFWKDIHQFVQPSRDADTLHSPVAFIEQLEQRLAQLPELSGCRLLISHSPELNYLQFPRSGRRERAELYADIVSGAPRFPPKLALIAMPYSQDSSLFPNLIICHEMGHFAFEELKLENELSPYIENSLQVHFPTNLSETDLSWCRERLWSWAEEIYCDRFAIGLVGPAYSFSYIEFFDVIGESENKEGVKEFFETHPCDACRFNEHAQQLRLTGWWPLLDRWGKAYADLIRILDRIPLGEYTFTSDEKPKLARRVLKAFQEVRPHVETLVKQTFDGHEARFDGEAEFKSVEIIQRYLSWGVVPATLVERKQRSRPDPVLLINAAYLFYLEGISTLINRIKQNCDEPLNDVAQREKWGRRIEQWTMKAMEDLRFPAPSKDSAS